MTLKELVLSMKNSTRTSNVIVKKNLIEEKRTELQFYTTFFWMEVVESLYRLKWFFSHHQGNFKRGTIVYQALVFCNAVIVTL